MELKIITKNTIYLASPKVLKFLVGLVKAKFIAIFLGPGGAGIIVQLSNILSRTSGLALSGMNDGLVRLIAKNNAESNDKTALARMIKTYLVCISVTSLLMFVLGYIFSKNITQFVFGDLEYHTYFLIGFAAMPIIILSSSSMAVIKAYKKIKILALSEIIIIILNILIFVPLIYFFKLTGAVIYVVLSFFVTFQVYQNIARNKILKLVPVRIREILKADFSNIYFKSLLSFLSVGIINVIYQTFCEVTTRSIVANQLGIEKIGIYSPIESWSGLFIGFILPSIFMYLYPRLSEVKSNKEIVLLINDTFRVVTFSLLPLVILGIAYRNIIIPLFYSKEFLEATLYLPYHFVCLFFAVWGAIFSQIFAPTFRLKSFTGFILFHNTLSLALVYFLTPEYGLYGFMARYTITPLLMFFLYWIFFKNKINFYFHKENLSLLLFSIFSGILMVFLPIPENIMFFLAPLLLFSSLLLLKKNEKKFIFEKYLYYKEKIIKRK